MKETEAGSWPKGEKPDPELLKERPDREVQFFTLTKEELRIAQLEKELETRFDLVQMRRANIRIAELKADVERWKIRCLYAESLIPRSVEGPKK